MSDRAFRFHLARVYLAEASRRRCQGGFYWWLVAAAQKARREAASMREPSQGGLF